MGSMNLSFAIATETDAPAIARLHTVTDTHLRVTHGRDTSESIMTEKAVRQRMKSDRWLVARFQGEIIAQLCLAKRKPWAIDPAYFTKVPTPLHLTYMAVSPEHQRKGVGRQMLTQACVVARHWPADALRLDAYDNETGAGGFYAKCGFREVGRVTYRRTPLIYYESLLVPAAGGR